MRNNDPIIYNQGDEHESIRQQAQQNYTDCITILQTQWYQADLDQRFAMGDQDIWGLIFPGVATYRRKIFNFNIINPIIQAISGFQRQTRKSTVCIPVMSPMQKTADQFTKCLYHVHKNSGAYQVYSDAFEQGALTQGLGFISMFLDYATDPISPEIKTRYIDMKSCLYDPYFRKTDMSDCRFFRTRQFFDKQEAALIYPQFADKILSLPKGSYRDDKFYYMPEVYQIQFPHLVAIDEYWYLASRKATFLIDKYTEEAQEFEGTPEQLKLIINKMGERIKVIKKNRQTVRRALLLNEKVIVDEPNPYGLDSYPIVPVTAYFTPDTPYYAYKFRSIVRDMRDAQFLFARRKTADLDIIESQQQGLKIKKGALVTPEDSLNSGAGRVLVVSEKAQMTDVEQMQIIPPSPIMLQMEEMLMNITYRIAGVDPSAMGIDVDDKAGIISMMRQAATSRNLQRLFDQLDEAQRLCGEIQLQMIQKNWTSAKIKNIIGEEPTDEFNNKLFFKYGCKVVQGTLTETQQQLELGQLLHLREMTQDASLNEDIVKAMTIQNKDEIIERLNKNAQQAAEQAQQMQQLQMQQLQVDNETKMAYAHSQHGLARERIAKIQTDKAIAEDKLKRAEQEDTASLLNLVRTIKEMQGMDTQQLSAKIDMLHRINELNFDDRIGTDMSMRNKAEEESQTPQPAEQQI